MELSEPNEKIPVIESAVYSLSTIASEAHRQMEKEGSEEERARKRLFAFCLINIYRHAI